METYAADIVNTNAAVLTVPSAPVPRMFIVVVPRATELSTCIVIVELNGGVPLSVGLPSKVMYTPVGGDSKLKVTI